MSSTHLLTLSLAHTRTPTHTHTCTRIMALVYDGICTPEEAQKASKGISKKDSGLNGDKVISAHDQHQHHATSRRVLRVFDSRSAPLARTGTTTAYYLSRHVPHGMHAYNVMICTVGKHAGILISCQHASAVLTVVVGVCLPTRTPADQAAAEGQRDRRQGQRRCSAQASEGLAGERTDHAGQGGSGLARVHS